MGGEHEAHSVSFPLKVEALDLPPSPPPLPLVHESLVEAGPEQLLQTHGVFSIETPPPGNRIGNDRRLNFSEDDEVSHGDGGTSGELSLLLSIVN